jgi:hypothetical protein
LGPEARLKGKDSSHAGRIGHEKVSPPGNIRSPLFVFLYRGRCKVEVGFQTISAGFLEGADKNQQHFPGETPKVKPNQQLR